MAPVRLIIYYQLEAYCGGVWEPVLGCAYACAEGAFRGLFNMLNPAPGQRLRRVGHTGYPPSEEWRPDFLYSLKQDRLVGL